MAFRFGSGTHGMIDLMTQIETIFGILGQAVTTVVDASNARLKIKMLSEIEIAAMQAVSAMPNISRHPIRVWMIRPKSCKHSSKN